MKATLLSTILLLITLAAAAQTGTIKGRVLTSDGKPAAFVTVGLEGSKIGAITGENGTYQLERIKPGSYTVKVTAVGVLPQEKSVNVVAGQVINVDDIQLEESASRLSEVVVAGERNAYKSNDVSNTLRIKPLSRKHRRTSR
ncbi:carboxypeptidase-like regulatory domain-containing protein [Chitinophaga sedimenti]|uniref:carboxypeptidase-like regulatory domain-containing protein n=1 Tax=Chitinophaga sedimenti TaxID=2033606 RepID=UPI0020064650|nr:carboxypeptidase-like regulatory domain-containing protein [Chitinophaga sedimenti]MCK7559834.1 carboxypeptidase-like regulatory domain-containing protein [Chitinophaga sedimenti]